MRILKKLRDKVRSAVRRMKSKFDALGSYTGSPDKAENDNKPTQDADDL